MARVTLNLSASDSGSGMGEMRFNNGTGWSAWVPYAATRDWLLPSGDGTKTVQAQFRDKVGNEGGAVSDSIMLDTARPTPTAPSPATVRRGRTATLKYQVDDPRPGSETAKATIKIKNRSGKTVKTLKPGSKPVNTALSARFQCTLSKGGYKFYVYATDAAGNVQVKAAMNRLTVK